MSTHDRLILAMLAGIYKKLGIRDDINPDLVLASVFGDKEWGLRWEYGSLYEDRQLPQPPEVNETTVILDMYRFLTASYGRLSAPEKAKVDASPHGSYVKFQGFDGNNDLHYGIMHYLVEDLGRYGEHKPTGVLNSHSMGTIMRYRRMVPIMNRHDSHVRGSLTADQIIEVLNG